LIGIKFTLFVGQLEKGMTPTISSPPRYRGLFADQFSDQLEILAGRGRVQSGAPIRFDHFLDGPGDRFAAQKGILQLDLPVWTSNRIFQPAAHAHLSKKFQRRFTWIMSI
jgi:hypothetical protein